MPDDTKQHRRQYGPDVRDLSPAGSRRLQPITPWRQRIWRAVSNVFIVAGVGLLALGGWMAYRQQVPLAGSAPPALPEEALSLAGSPLPTAAASEVPSLEGNPLPVVEFSSPGLVPSPSRTPSPPATPTVRPTPTPKPGQTPPPPATPGPEPTATRQATTTPVPPVQSPPSWIVSSAINLNAPVSSIGWHQVIINDQTVSVWDVAEFAAGWHKNSAWPGQVGNTVLSGHHNIKGEVFRNLVDLEPGDVITLYADEQPFAYTVDLKFIVRDKGEPPAVRQQNARWIGPFSDERLTLITCWPYNNNTHRLVVVAKPAPGLEEPRPVPLEVADEGSSITTFLEDLFR